MEWYEGHFKVIYNDKQEKEETPDTLIFQSYYLDKSHLTDDSAFVRERTFGNIVGIAYKL